MKTIILTLSLLTFAFACGDCGEGKKDIYLLQAKDGTFRYLVTNNGDELTDSLFVARHPQYANNIKKTYLYDSKEVQGYLAACSALVVKHGYDSKETQSYLNTANIPKTVYLKFTTDYLYKKEWMRKVVIVVE